ncbi:MAG: hypothetical protein E6R05_04710 [Candidatus Moraniibacteriota bacterium]|nr:MAG: hypothetical protein E6R05_04710 [Candidatus Moranbacteria bacterium]
MVVQKVILHNLTVPFLPPGTDIFNFDQNGVLFAETGDIVITRLPIAGAYLSFLSECGWNFDQTMFLNPPQEIPRVTTSIFADLQLMRQIKAVPKDKPQVLDTFISTRHEQEWASKLGILYEAKQDQLSFGNKSFFRSLAQKYAFPLAKGFIYQKNILGATIAASSLFMRGFSEIVVKHNSGAAAVGSRRFTLNKLLRSFDDFEQCISSPLISDLSQKWEDNTFVIEGWCDRVVASPSMQYYIDMTGAATCVSLHLQLFYADSMKYKGCLSEHWIGGQLQKRLRSEGQRFSSILAKLGYRGHVGYNTILLDDGRILWTEINPRRVMSSYPFQLYQRLFNGRSVSTRYRSEQFTRPSWKGKSIDTVLQELKPILFDKNQGRGIIPFSYELLHSQGRLSLVAFGATSQEVESFFDHVDHI